MNTIIQTDGFELTSALNDHVKTKLKKLDRFNLTNLRCLMKPSGRDFEVELLADGRFFKLTDADMYSAITKAVEKFSECLSRSKD